jgi:aminopeptidase YwaD
MTRFAAVVVALTTLAGLNACVSDGGDERPSAPSSAGPSQTTSPRTFPATSPTPSGPASPAPLAAPDGVRAATAIRAVRHLAGRIGPRPGTSPAYMRAAAWVGRQLADEGWEVRRQRFHTPAGVSWGVPVPAGQSVNLVATRGDVRPGRPWLSVGAHLDTVPQAPGAEDNASGIGVLLTVAQALRDTRTRLPVVLLAFGSEEPRGSTDDDHHYGSRAFVADLGARERRTLRGMVALDRVGVGEMVPVSSARGPDPMRAQLLAAARRAEVPAEALTGDRASDHWSFVRAGLPAARLGSTPYVGYHSAGDLPAVVDRDQLERTARTVVAWLAPR